MNDMRGSAGRGRKPFLVLFLRAAQRVEARVEGALSDKGLSLAKLGVLNHLVESGQPLTLGELAGRICCVKSNMTQLIDRLEADGLVARVDHPADRRSVHAVITAEGRHRYAAGARILQEQERELLKGFKAAQLKNASALLEQLGEGSNF
jgi:DNA-binding MarR family transcriptional regulator